MSPHFSIIMPTCNRYQFINEAIRAILEQDYENWELIIKDGGYRSIAGFLPKDDRIIYIYGKDTGITHALNQGLTLATGDIHSWANDDDVLAPGALSYVAKNIGNAQWFYGRAIATPNPDFYGENQGTLLGEEWNFEKHLTQYNLVPQPAVYWTANVEERIGPFDASQDLVSDYDYWIRLGKRYTPKTTTKVLAYYRLHPNQITSTIFAEQSRQAELIRRKHQNEL